MRTLAGTATLLGLTLILGCSSPHGARPAKFGKPDEVLVDASAVAELLDAIQSELVVENLCKGGEQLRLAIRAESSDNPRLLYLYYSVPDVLTIFREGYMQRDGVVFLADSLAWRNIYTRWSTHPVDQDEFEDVFHSSATRISCAINGKLTKEQLSRHNERVRRVQELRNQP